VDLNTGSRGALMIWHRVEAMKVRRYSNQLNDPRIIVDSNVPSIIFNFIPGMRVYKVAMMEISLKY